MGALGGHRSSKRSGVGCRGYFQVVWMPPSPGVTGYHVTRGLQPAAGVSGGSALPPRSPTSWSLLPPASDTPVHPDRQPRASLALTWGGACLGPAAAEGWGPTPRPRHWVGGGPQTGANPKPKLAPGGGNGRAGFHCPFAVLLQVGSHRTDETPVLLNQLLNPCFTESLSRMIHGEQ